jgi:RNA polymerase sigma factor (sigma-70 family)
MRLARLEAPRSTTEGLTIDVKLAAAGDRAAFERLYRAHVNQVYSLCVRMTADRERAEELTQDAFVRAWEKLTLFRGESSFTTWLYRLTVNVVLNARRTDARCRQRLSVSLDDRAGLRAAGVIPMVAPPFAPGERMDIEAAIAALPVAARRAFVLHDVSGYRHDEIGQMLHITTGGSKSAVHRARRLLRQTLGDGRATPISGRAPVRVTRMSASAGSAA